MEGLEVLDKWMSLLLGPGNTTCRIVKDDQGEVDAEFLNSEGRWRSLFSYGGECAVLERLEQVLVERNKLRAALSVLMRVMTDSLPCSLLEGPDVAAALLDAGLLEEMRTEDGKAGWRLNAFAQELLRHEDLPASPSESEPGSTEPSSPSEVPDEQTPPAPE